MDLLTTLNLKQLVSTATHTTLHSATLMDHIITNRPKHVIHSGVPPCLLIRDRDAHYVCVNVQVTHFMPRYKLICREYHFNKQVFIRDFGEFPLSLIHSTDDPNMQVELLNSLIRECLDRHAPLKCTKVTRPSAPWRKNLNIPCLQESCRSVRERAHEKKSEPAWNKYKDAWNKLKSQKMKQSVSSITRLYRPVSQRRCGELFIEFFILVPNLFWVFLRV